MLLAALSPWIWILSPWIINSPLAPHCNSPPARYPEPSILNNDCAYLVVGSASSVGVKAFQSTFGPPYQAAIP